MCSCLLSCGLLIVRNINPSHDASYLYTHLQGLSSSIRVRGMHMCQRIPAGAHVWHQVAYFEVWATACARMCRIALAHGYGTCLDGCPCSVCPMQGYAIYAFLRFIEAGMRASLMKHAVQ